LATWDSRRHNSESNRIVRADDFMYYIGNVINVRCLENVELEKEEEAWLAT
jgi:hypothetical protein